MNWPVMVAATGEGTPDLATSRICDTRIGVRVSIWQPVSAIGGHAGDESRRVRSCG